MFSTWVSFFLKFISFHFVARTFSQRDCELISIPQCRSMPYNMTRFTNSFDQFDQMVANRSFQQYDALIATNCSKDLVFFLCAKSVPFCFSGQGLPHPILPCRSVCQRVKRDCMPVIRRSGGKWPKKHDCSLLPEYGTSVCITPQAFQKSPGPGKKTRLIFILAGNVFLTVCVSQHIKLFII